MIVRERVDRKNTKQILENVTEISECLSTEVPAEVGLATLQEKHHREYTRTKHIALNDRTVLHMKPH